MDTSLTLREFLRDYYAPLKGISSRTCILYEQTIRPFSEFLKRDATLSDLTEINAARFLSDRLKKRSAATVAKDRAQLRAMWEFAARKGMVNTWPTIKRIVVPDRVPEAWFTADMCAIFRAADAEPGMISGAPAGRFWRALILLGYETGERVGGLLSLRWQDVSERGVIFRAEGRKGRRRDLYSEISPECYRSLCEIRTLGDLVFNWDKTYTYLWRRLGEILKRAGLPADRRCKFHKIRRTTASYYEAGGGSAQQLLDHSSPVVTKRYIDPRIARRPSASEVIPKVG